MSQLRVLSLGWGVQSWTIAAMVALGELDPIDYAIHADTSHERSGTYTHAAKWTPWLEEHGVRVVTVKEGRTDAVREDWSNSVMIPAFTTNLTGERGQVRRQCTGDWKVGPIRRFLRTKLPRGNPRPAAVEMVMGISWDESQRVRPSDVAYIVNAYPLVDRRITRAGCTAWLEAHGLDVPPKSACVFCPFHTLAQWKADKRAGGADWDEAVAVDLAIRDQRPGHVLFVHPSRKPLTEAVKIPGDLNAQLALELEDEQPCDSGHCFT